MKQKRAQKDSARPFEKVPIYQLAREVLRESHVIAARMSQGYKYSLGNALREAAMGATRALRDSPCDTAAMDRSISYLGIMRHTHAFDARKRVCTTAALPGLVAHDSEYTKLFYR